MFASATPKTAVRLYIAAVLLAGLGYAAHLGEEGQLDSAETVSLWIYGISLVVFYYATLVAFILWRRHLKSRRK